MVFTVTPGADRGPTWTPPAVDWVTTFGVPDPDALSARLGERFQAVTQPATQYVFLNANGPPFDQPKARAAVAYAIDRRAAVSDWNSAGEVACQILPPSIPGYEPYCPYTLHPNDRGDWTSPDTLKARKLLRQSGETGRHVTVYAPKDVTGMEDVVAAMNSIGLVARLHKFDSATYFSDVQALGDRAQAGFTGWGADYPAASNFFQPQLSCSGGGNFGRYCDPALDREMAAVARLQVKDPVAALARWTRIDHEVTDVAPLVPLIVPIGADVHSDRLGHHARNIILGPLFAQAWVR
jgi:peptide/nickel transport system substrate-binding protein